MSVCINIVLRYANMIMSEGSLYINKRRLKTRRVTAQSYPWHTKADWCWMRTAGECALSAITEDMNM